MGEFEEFGGGPQGAFSFRVLVIISACWVRAFTRSNEGSFRPLGKGLDIILLLIVTSMRACTLNDEQRCGSQGLLSTKNLLLSLGAREL